MNRVVFHNSVGPSSRIFHWLFFMFSLIVNKVEKKNTFAYLHDSQNISFLETIAFQTFGCLVLQSSCFCARIVIIGRHGAVDMFNVIMVC